MQVLLEYSNLILVLNHTNIYDCRFTRVPARFSTVDLEGFFGPRSPSYWGHYFCCWLWPPRRKASKRARNVLLIFQRSFQREKCMLTARTRNVSLIPATFYDLRNSLAPAMNHCKKKCPWCDFRGVMCLVFFTALATRDVPSAAWCELRWVKSITYKDACGSQTLVSLFSVMTEPIFLDGYT